MTGPAERFWISKARLETLVDGIFAIAMTLLILEIRVPELGDRRSAAELLQGVGALAPAMTSYLLSFTMLAIFWYRHHRLLHLVRRVDVPFFAWTIVFLVGATLFPFAAAVLGRYPVNPLAPAIYAAPVVLISAGLALQWVRAERNGLLLEEIHPAERRHMRRRSLMAPLFVGVMFCLLAGRSWVWGYAPLVVLLPLLLWNRFRRD